LVPPVGLKASAVAVAEISTVLIPIICAKNVGIALPCAAVRCTITLIRGFVPAASAVKHTSLAPVGGQAPIVPEIPGFTPPTRLLFPMATACAVAGEVTAELVHELLDAPPTQPDLTKYVAPANAAASAARCASLRTV
jgi:hypothetical protein